MNSFYFLPFKYLTSSDCTFCRPSISAPAAEASPVKVLASPAKTVEVAAVSACNVATDDVTDEDDEDEKRLATDSWEDHSGTGTPATTPGNTLKASFGGLSGLIFRNCLIFRELKLSGLIFRTNI